MKKLFLLSLFVGVAFFAVPVAAHADPQPTKAYRHTDSKFHAGQLTYANTAIAKTSTGLAGSFAAAKPVFCGGVSVGFDVGCDPKDNNPIHAYLAAVIKWLSGLIAAAAAIMIVVSGIQYITSSGNPDATKAAKSRLTNAILGIILFIFMFAILNWLIPGGVLQ